MLDWATLVLFIGAATLLLISPGPAVLYIVARSIDQGRWAGLVSVFGIAIGSLFHIAAAAFGLSAILASSALAFSLIKYLGAAYLVYLGVRTLLSKEAVDLPGDVDKRRLREIFYQGIVVNVLNPKTALFFFAFLPQFVDPARGSSTLQILALGAIFFALALISDGLYALLAGTIGHWIRGNLQFLRAQRYFAGTVYIALGVATAVSGARQGK